MNAKRPAGDPGAEIIDRNMPAAVVRVTEKAAIAAAGWRGKGDEKAADAAAVHAMRDELSQLDIDGLVVIGEGERDQAPMLFIGEEVGSGKGTPVDIAVDPLEGTTLCAKNQYDSLCVLAMSERGGLLHAPDVYMEKIAVGPDYPDGIVDLDHSVEDNIKALAKFRKVPVSEITACVLDRPRHTALIEELRDLGVPVKLIGDGDIAGAIHTTNPDAGIDIYIGSGGAPEGVLAASAMRCAGGQFQGRLIIDTPDRRERAKAAGIKDFNRKYAVTDLASGDVIFSATGVTDGSLLSGVKLRSGSIVTSSVVMRSWSRTTRWVTAQHPR